MTTLAEPQVHDHPSDVPQPYLEHQYNDLPQQQESTMLGMWIFLATEIMFFGGLICSYIIFRASYRDVFEEAGHHLDVILGAFNTIVLLTSSLTMALAVRASQFGRIKHCIYLIIATMVFGCMFLGVKYIEYSSKYEHGLFPGLHWDWAHAEALHAQESGREATVTHPPDTPPTWFAATGSLAPDPSARTVLPVRVPSASDQAKLFFTYYFFMTGLHALHLIIGVIMLGIFAVLLHRRWFSGTGALQVEVAGLYWHFIDIVWVYLYPALYLIDLSR
jgi:cytochrome c oxidase subunit 3